MGTVAFQMKELGRNWHIGRPFARKGAGGGESTTTFTLLQKSEDM